VHADLELERLVAIDRGVWPVFGEAPVPGWVSMIFSPEGVVMTGWARVGVAVTVVVAMAASASKASRRGRARILALLEKAEAPLSHVRKCDASERQRG
jgi:hypothetical protein